MAVLSLVFIYLLSEYTKPWFPFSSISFELLCYHLNPKESKPSTHQISLRLKSSSKAQHSLDIRLSSLIHNLIAHIRTPVPSTISTSWLAYT